MSPDQDKPIIERLGGAGLSTEQIRKVPAGKWYVRNGSCRSGDVEGYGTTLIAIHDGSKISLGQSDYHHHSYHRPDQVGTNPRPGESSNIEYHPWSTRHPLFNEIANAIKVDVSKMIVTTAENLNSLIRESELLRWQDKSDASIRFFEGGLEGVVVKLVKEGEIVRGSLTVKRGDYVIRQTLDENVARSAFREVLVKRGEKQATPTLAEIISHPTGKWIVKYIDVSDRTRPSRTTELHGEIDGCAVVLKQAVPEDATRWNNTVGVEANKPWLADTGLGFEQVSKAIAEHFNQKLRDAAMQCVENVAKVPVAAWSVTERKAYPSELRLTAIAEGITYTVAKSESCCEVSLRAEVGDFKPNTYFSGANAEKVLAAVCERLGRNYPVVFEREPLSAAPAPLSRHEAALALFTYSDTIFDREQRAAYKEWVNTSPAAQKYAAVLAGMFDKSSGGRLDHVAADLRDQCTHALRERGVEISEHASSTSWAFWDIAKQSYFAAHPAQTNSHYRPGNALLDEKVRADILDRHLGWEVYGAVQRDSYVLSPLVERISDPLMRRRFVELLEMPPKQEVMTLSSYLLTELGSIFRNYVGNIRHADPANPLREFSAGAEAPWPGRPAHESR